MFGGPGTPVHLLCPSSMCKFPGPPGGPLSELTIGSSFFFFFFYKILFILTSQLTNQATRDPQEPGAPILSSMGPPPLPFMAWGTPQCD